MGRSILLLIAIISLASCQTFTGFNYASQGRDWEGMCATGEYQSPINIDTNSGSCDNSLALDIAFSTAGSFSVVDTGTTLKADVALSQLYATDIDGILTGYNAQYFVFRAPSEHQIEGNSYPLEMQIVHYINSFSAQKGQTNKNYAIVSILFELSTTDNPFIAALKLNALNTPLSNIDFNALLGATYSQKVPYYAYQGSFTTPNCDENVNYYVFATPMPISNSQLALFNNKYAGSSSFAGGNGNNRVIQDLNDRTVKKGGVECEEQFVYFFSFLILYIFINYFIFKLL